MFTVNLVNIALLNQTTLPLNLSNYYTQLVYQQDSNFNPIQWAFTFTSLQICILNMWRKEKWWPLWFFSICFPAVSLCSIDVRLRVQHSLSLIRRKPRWFFPTWPRSAQTWAHRYTHCLDLFLFTHAGIWVHFRSPLCRSQQLWRATSARTSMPMTLPPLATSAAACLQGSSLTLSPRIW